ncbi:MAG: hypothetical protein ABI432_11310, partial [Flavobacteriales bacterium]
MSTRAFITSIRYGICMFLTGGFMCDAIDVFGQPQHITKTSTWPSPKGRPKLNDTLELAWSKPSYEFTSFGTTATMELGFDHHDLTAARAMDLVATIEVTATINSNLTKYDPRADHDSLFTLHYRIGKRSQGVARSAHVFPDSLLDRKIDAIDRQIIACRNVHRLSFKLLKVEANLGQGFKRLDELPVGVRFTSDIVWDVMPKMDRSNAPALNTPQPINCDGNTSGVDELLVSWGVVSGATSYHLEWTWVDDYEPNGVDQIDPTDLYYDLGRNATRVSINGGQTYYSIPLLFDRGWLVYRVRAMGEDPGPPIRPTYGDWSLVEASGFVADVAAYAKEPIAPHQREANWQFTTSFAEEGKRKEVMTYADGTLRSRQAVTRNNSLYVPIIGETFYDAVGRPAVEAMPVPMVRGKECPTLVGDDTWAPIDLYPRFNNADEVGDGSGDPVDYQYFHMLPPNPADCDASGIPFHPVDGAELYYHPDHLGVTDALTGKPGFLPQAEGYPFTQTEFTRDNTGRVRSKSGVGETFKLGSGHESTFLYGKPEQIKLDRLFGSEAGVATHYQKNVVLDANGQASVSYLDRAGRTVATALAGLPTADLVPLAPFTDPALSPTYETDLFCGQTSLECEANEHLPDVPALVFTDQIVVPANGLRYVFKYSMQPGIMEDPCLKEDICLNCVYELSISLVDGCGQEHIFEDGSATIGTFQESPGGPLVFAACGTLPGEYVHPNIPVPDLDFELELPAGEYTLTKILRVSSEAREAYLEEILANGETYLNEDCFTPQDQLQAQFTDAIDYSGCDIDCPECVAALGPLEDFLLAGGSEQDFNQLLEQCNAPCEADSWCDVAYMAMLVDMTLGGQYANISVDGNGETTTEDRASVFFYDSGSNDRSILLSRGFQWSFDHYAYSSPDFQNVLWDRELWRQPRLFESGSHIPEYRTEAGVRYTISVEWIDDAWAPEVKNNDPAYVFPDGSGGFITYPEFLGSLDLFISYWQPGFEKSLLFYHPEYCYWLNCRGYSEKLETPDPWSSDEFDEYLLLSEWTDAIADGLVNLSAPIGQRIRFVYNTNVGGFGFPAGRWDPFAVHATDYGPHAENLLVQFNDYKAIDPGPMLSMEEFASIMGYCESTPTWPVDPAWLDFLGGSDDDVKMRQWTAFKSYYFSEKYRAQKRRADATVAACGSCSGLNYCIGEGEDDAWVSRMQSPVMQLHPDYWPLTFPSWPWLLDLYYEHREIYSQEHGRPYVQGCQLCNDVNHPYFVDKVPRVPDPEQFPGMSMSPEEMAYQNYMATDDCPVAAAWRTLFEERAVEDQLATLGVALGSEPGWAALVIAQDGQGAPIPPATWDGIVAGNTLNISVNGCPASLTLADPSVLTTYGFSTYTDLLDAVFAAPGIEATTANTFILHVQFMDNTLTPHPTTLTGTVCAFYDLINCTFPPVGTGNQLADDLEDLLTAIASAEPPILGSIADVNLNTTPTTPSVPPGPPPFTGATAGPMIQSQVPGYFTTGDWNEDLIWTFVSGSTFTIASGAIDNCPRYEIEILNYEVPDGSTWTMADIEDIFEFQNMVSAGSNLFEVDIYGTPDWTNGIPPPFLATLHGSVTYFPCTGDPEGPSLGEFGDPDPLASCTDPAIELTRRLYEVMTHLLIQAPDHQGYDLTTSPYMNWELLSALYDWQGNGADPLNNAGIYADDQQGPQVVWTPWPNNTLLSLPYPAAAYSWVILDNARCPVLYYPVGALDPGGFMDINVVTGFSEPFFVGDLNVNGAYESFAFFALGPDGEPLHEYPFIVYAHCLDLRFCDNCAMDGPFLPTIAIPPPLETDCAILAQNLFDAINTFNA